MVVNISRGARKLAQTLTLKKKHTLFVFFYCLEHLFSLFKNKKYIERELSAQIKHILN